MTSGNLPVYKALYGSYTGISPVLAQEVCCKAGIDGDQSTALFTDLPEGETLLERLYDAFCALMAQVSSGDFHPVIFYENGAPTEYSALPLSMYESDEQKRFLPSVRC